MRQTSSFQWAVEMPRVDVGVEFLVPSRRPVEANLRIARLAMVVVKVFVILHILQRNFRIHNHLHYRLFEVDCILKNVTP